MMKDFIKHGGRLLTAATGALLIAITWACNPEPDESDLYTATGETAADYIKRKPELSSFDYILSRVGLDRNLSAYGEYTCFIPTNEGVAAYIDKLYNDEESSLPHNGMTENSLEGLTDSLCNEIARYHLSAGKITTIDLGVSSQSVNTLLRVPFTTDGTTGNVVINQSATILQPDSVVTNGVVHVIDSVIPRNTRLLPEHLSRMPEFSIFYAALEMTGLSDSLKRYRKDATYTISDRKDVNNSGQQTVDLYSPDDCKIMYTIFAEPDSVFRANGINSVQDLKAKADEWYGGADAWYDYPSETNHTISTGDDYTNRFNTLNMFVAYHILNRKQEDFNMFTSYGRHMTTEAFKNMGVVTRKINPQEWYETLCPFTMMKIEKSTVIKHFAGDKTQRHYINRRIDDVYPNGSGSTGGIIKNDQHGAMIIAPGQSSHELPNYSYTTVGPNGCYYLLDDIIAFDKRVRDIVFNCRVRMDINTIFPELDTEGIRLNGDETHQGSDYDKSGKDGYNYWFPNGYLSGVKSTGFFIYRRPRNHYDSYQGDEFNMFGNYDITFRLPPCFPTAGDYQIRMGFAQETTRGIAQVYFDNQPQGIPLDMTITSSDPRIGMTFPDGGWDSYSEEEKQAERKALKNKGYYRGPAGICRANGNTALWVDNGPTYRMVLCTVHISDPNEYHYLRFRNVSDNGKTEFMLDWLEVVPKSVYGITDEGIPEDDL